MSKYFTFWASITELSCDFDVAYVTASSWVLRGEIPAKYDIKTVSLGQKRGFKTSLKSLAEWHEAHRARREAIRLEESDPPLPPLPFLRSKEEVS